MNEQQLRCFKAAAESESMNKAAVLLSTSVTAVKRHIDSLEAELGVPLLFRTNHGLRLTDMGKEFLPFAGKILREIADEKQKLTQIADKQKKVIRIGYDNVQVRDTMFIDACATDLAIHPDVQIVTRETPHFDTELFDLFFGAGYDHNLDIRAHLLVNMPITCILRDTDPRAEKDVIELEDLDLKSTIFPPEQMLAYTEPSLAKCLGSHAQYMNLRQYSTPATTVILGNKVIVYIGYEPQTGRVCQRQLAGFTFRYQCYSYQIENKETVKDFVKYIQKFYREKLG